VGKRRPPAAVVGAREGRPREPSGREVPEPQLAVTADRDELAAVGLVGDAKNEAVLAAERAPDSVSALGVPEVDVAGEVAGGDALPVRREADREDRVAVGDRSLESAPLDIPYDDLPVEARACEQPAVGREVE